MPQTYTVQPGDTLSAIGAQFGVPFQQITGFSSGNPNLIYPGEVLTIPGSQPSAPQPTPIAPTIQADQIQPPTQIDLPPGSSQSQFVTGLTSQVDTFRSQLEGILAQQKAEADAKLEALRQKEQETLDRVGELTTPFQEELETTERERLFINKKW